MRPPESFVWQPVRSLQTMLQVIAQNDPDYVSVIPDGIYGPETIRAVAAFQRRHMLPVTGITDLLVNTRFRIPLTLLFTLFISILVSQLQV